MRSATASRLSLVPLRARRSRPPSPVSYFPRTSTYSLPIVANPGFGSYIHNGKR